MVKNQFGAQCGIFFLAGRNRQTFVGKVEKSTGG